MNGFDRRAIIFWIFSLVSLVLLVPCPAEFHTVGLVLAIVYAVLGAGSWLDSRGRRRRKERA